MSSKEDSTVTRVIDTIDFHINVARWIGLICFVVALCAVFIPLYKDRVYNEYGDYLGGVAGTILSFGTMAFLYLTYQLQRKEILLQQNLLEKERSERADESKANAKDELRQKMDSRFFRILKLHNDTVSAMDITSPNNVISQGRDCFRTMVRQLTEKVSSLKKESLANAINNGNAWNGIDEREVGNIAVERICTQYPNDIDIYLKSIIGVCRHLDIMNKAGIDLVEYSPIFRSQLSVNELLMIYYISKSDSGMKTKIQTLASGYSTGLGLNIDLEEKDLIYLSFTSREMKDFGFPTL